MTDSGREMNLSLNIEEISFLLHKSKGDKLMCQFVKQINEQARSGNDASSDLTP